MNSKNNLLHTLAFRLSASTLAAEWALEKFGEEICSNLIDDCGWYGRLGADPGASEYDNYGKLANCCGVYEIAVNSMDENELKKTMLRVLFDGIPVVVMSVNKAQEKQHKMLTDFGFVSTPWRRNPNSGNEIAVLTYTFPEFTNEKL